MGNTCGKEHLGSKQVLATLLFCCMFKQADMLCLVQQSLFINHSGIFAESAYYGPTLSGGCTACVIRTAPHYLTMNSYQINNCNIIMKLTRPAAD